MEINVTFHCQMFYFIFLVNNNVTFETTNKVYKEATVIQTDGRVNQCQSL